MKKEWKDTLKWCLILALVIYMMCAIISIVFIWMTKRYDNYIRVEGMIIDTWKRNYRDEGQSLTNYYTKFSYEIDGKYYENTTKGINYDALDLITVNVLINPKNYQKSIIENDVKSNEHDPSILFISATIVNIFMIVVNMSSVAKTKKEDEE